MNNDYTYVKDGKMSPQIQIICRNCGLMREFSTLFLFK